MYNKYQSKLHAELGTSAVEDPSKSVTTVIYGHDSASSLQLREYTKGLDTGCYKGKKLTALVVEDGGKQSVVQVKCNNYRKSKVTIPGF